MSNFGMAHVDSQRSASGKIRKEEFQTLEFLNFIPLFEETSIFKLDY